MDGLTSSASGSREGSSSNDYRVALSFGFNLQFLLNSPSLLIRLPRSTLRISILSHLHSQPGRRCTLVRFCALLFVAQLVHLAVNSVPALRLPRARTRCSCGQPRHSTLLLPRFVLVLVDVSLLCPGHLAQFAQFAVVLCGEFC